MTNERDSTPQKGKCTSENALLEIDLWSMGQQEAIKSIIVWETKKGYEVSVILKKVPKAEWKSDLKYGSEIPLMYAGIIKWTETKVWFITTRRNREKPKLYKDLNRLNEHLKKTCPDMKYILIRESKKPGKIRKPAAK